MVWCISYRPSIYHQHPRSLLITLPFNHGCLSHKQCNRLNSNGKMYPTLNVSTSEDLNYSRTHTLKLDFSHHRHIKVCIISVLGVMITLGNIAVLMVIASAVSGWKRNTRYLLLSLTGADSAFGLVVMPMNLWVSLFKDYSQGPDILCHVVAFCNATVYSTCIYTLASTSFERYIAVFYPLKYSTLMTRRRTLLLIAFAWCFPPLLLLPISFPEGMIIEVHFSGASLVCNPIYSTNVPYSLTLVCFIFFPCSVIMTYANIGLWCAAKKQRLKLRKYSRSNRPDIAVRVVVPVMTVYYTCWTPCIAAMIYNAITGNRVPEWVEFVVVWLPASNGFLNCIFYFWTNHSFRTKLHFTVQKWCLFLCPGLASSIGCSADPQAQFVTSVFPGPRSTSVSSTCTLLTLADHSTV